MSDFTNTHHCKASKAHRCIWCGETINAGDVQVVTSGRWDGRLLRDNWHPECDVAWTEELARDRELQFDGFTPYSFERGSAATKGTV